MKPPTGAQSAWKQGELALSPLWATWRRGEASPGPQGVLVRQPELCLEGQLRTSPPTLQGRAGLLSSWSQPCPLCRGHAVRAWGPVFVFAPNDPSPGGRRLWVCQ